MLLAQAAYAVGAASGAVRVSRKLFDEHLSSQDYAVLQWVDGKVGYAAFSELQVVVW